MTLAEQRIAAHQTATKQRIKALQDQLRKGEARQRALDRKKYLARCHVVAHLVEAAGLLWCPDDMLEKLLMTAAAQLTASGATPGTIPGRRNATSGSLRRSFASTSSASRTAAKWEDGEGEMAPLGGEDKTGLAFDRSDYRGDSPEN